MSKSTKKTEATDGIIQDIPLNRLKKSPRNVRKMPHPQADIEALAASIAAHGLLQNPVVEPEIKEDKPTGYYLVTIGEGRRQAFLLRAKRKEIAKDAPVRCMVETAHNAAEISLAENAVRSLMHPADQFEAFQRLHIKEGLGAEDIAARFGVSANTVKQRLKLAAVSPMLMALYREGEMTLEQLSGFAICDDHAKQERVWEKLGDYCRRPDIVKALKGDQIAANDPLVKFVTLVRYTKAGGTIERDLFDEESEGFIANPELLHRLVQARLEKAAAKLRAEGWKWVEAPSRADRLDFVDFSRVYPKVYTLSNILAAKLEALEAEYAQIKDGDDEEAIEALEKRIEGAKPTAAFNRADIARAGAIVFVDWNGKLSFERGLVRPEDEIAPSKPVKLVSWKGIPDTLVKELVSARTLALRDAAANDSALALASLLHALVGEAFYWSEVPYSCVDIDARPSYRERYAPEVASSDAAVRNSLRHDEWVARLPEQPAALWDFILGLNAGDRMALLAHCVALNVDTSLGLEGRSQELKQVHVQQVSKAAKLDMAANWQPNVENYLGRVSKDRILEAVREGVSKEAADNLANMKKQALAEAAAKRLQGTGWLPEVLRMPEPLAQAAE